MFMKLTYLALAIVVGSDYRNEKCMLLLLVLSELVRRICVPVFFWVT